MNGYNNKTIKYLVVGLMFILQTLFCLANDFPKIERIRIDEGKLKHFKGYFKPRDFPRIRIILTNSNKELRFDVANKSNEKHMSFRKISNNTYLVGYDYECRTPSFIINCENNPPIEIKIDNYCLKWLPLGGISVDYDLSSSKYQSLLDGRENTELQKDMSLDESGDVQPKIEYQNVDESLLDMYRKYFNTRCEFIRKITTNADEDLEIEVSDNRDVNSTFIKKIADKTYLIGYNLYSPSLTIKCKGQPKLEVNLSDYCINWNPLQAISIEYDQKTIQSNSSNHLAATSERSVNDKIKIERVIELSADISARRFGKVDEYDQPCALVKVKCPLSGLQFPNGLFSEDKGNGEYWAYYKNGTKYLHLRHESDIDITIDVTKYGIPQLSGKVTYSISIKPANDVYLSQFDEIFEDEEDDEIDENLLFGDEYLSIINDFGFAIGELFNSRTLPTLMLLSDDKFQSIKEASEAGWPDATMMLLCILKGSRYCLYDEFDSIDLHPYDKTFYMKESPKAKAFISGGYATIDMLKERYKEQVEHLNKQLSIDKEPIINTNELNVEIRCSPFEYQRLQKLAAQYSYFQYILNPTGQSELLGHYKHPGENAEVGMEKGVRGVYAKGKYHNDMAQECIGKRVMSDVCVRYIDRMRAHRWVNFVNEVSKYKVKR